MFREHKVASKNRKKNSAQKIPESASRPPVLQRLHGLAFQLGMAAPLFGEGGAQVFVLPLIGARFGFDLCVALFFIVALAQTPASLWQYGVAHRLHHHINLVVTQTDTTVVVIKD